MRRSLLNKRILPKPLRQALVLITLLLLPSAAWGQGTEYPLSIGGTTVTSENISTFSGVSYDASKFTLTLESTSLEAPIEWLDEDHGLTIELNSVNRISTSTENIPIIKGNTHSSLTIKKAENSTNSASLSLEGIYGDTFDSETGSPVIVGFTSISSSGLKKVLNTNGSNITFIYDEKPSIDIAGSPYTESGFISSLDGVSLDYENNTLYLNNATIEASTIAAIDNSLESLTIILKGTNKIISASSDAITSYNELATLNIVKDASDAGETQLIISAPEDEDAIVDFRSISYTGFTPYSVVEGEPASTIDITYDPINGIKQGDNILHSVAFVAPAPSIMIAGFGPDADGKFNDLDGVTFTPANTENETPATLALNNANFGPSYKGIVWSGNGTLKIQYSGNNKINTRNGNELNVGDDAGYCIIGNSSSGLILSASDDASTLTLKPSTGGTPESNNSRAAISGFTSVSLDDGWGSYYTDGYSEANLTSLTAGYEVIISNGKPLGLSVGGVVVTNKNQGDILGDGKVSFTSATTVVDNPGASTPATLTLLNGATISGNIQSSISPLTVYLKGSSTITPSNTSDAPFQYTGTESSATLTFESSEADDGELTLGGAFSKEEKGETGEKYFQFSSGNYTYSNQICEWYSSTTFQYSRHTYTYWGVKNEKIFYNAHYGITINDYEVTKFNKENVTGDNYDFAYFPDDNYLIVPDNISHTSSFEIKSHRAELNIQIKGDCAVKAIKFDDSKTKEFGAPDTKVLNIDRSSSSTPGKNTLTIYTDSSDPAISGFTAVNISENLHFNVPETAPSAGESYPNKVVLSDEELYDLWVGGEHVSSRNASNILDLNEFNETQAVFDAEKSILTLTNARISVSDGNAIESGLANLTVDIEGESNNIMCSGTNDHAFKATGSSNKITFTTTSEEAVSLSISGGLTPIDGFDTNYGNGLGLLYSSTDQKYSIETLETPEITGTAETEGGITVALSLPSDEKYASNTTMYYSITYSDETIDFAEYSSAFNMVKPGTVTAYLVPLGGKSNNAVGKYYGYPDAPYTMAVGDELTPEIYPAIDENDGIGLTGASSGDEDIASFTYSDGIVKATGIGSTTLTAIYSFGDLPFTVLNPIADPQASTEFAATFSVIVGGSLSDYFEGNNNFCTFYNTDQTTTYAKPEGMMAYVITGADPETGKVTTAETTVLPPNTPVLLEKGSAKAFTYIPATSGTAPSGNILLYTGNTDVQATEGSNLYVLYNDKFVKVTTDTRILSQKCYLKLNTSSSGTRSYYNIDGSDGTTGIREVKSEGVKGEKLADSAWHDLQGCKFTTKPTKPGLYILNGKKVVIK